MTKHKLKTTICAASVATLSISLATASFAQSRQNQQGANALGDLIGMIANASAKSNAKKKWAKVSPEIQQCVNTMFSSKNINVDQIIAAGMSPNAKDIAPVMELCQKVLTAQLKTDFPCNVPNSKGVQVPTTCVQSYAKAVNGKWAPVSRDDFLRAVGNDEQINVADFETTVAQNARLAEEKRLAQEAAAKEQAARRERLAREEEERRRFAASPEGKRQAAERAARERRAAEEARRADAARKKAAAARAASDTQSGSRRTNSTPQRTTTKSFEVRGKCPDTPTLTETFYIFATSQFEAMQEGTRRLREQTSFANRGCQVIYVSDGL